MRLLVTRHPVLRGHLNSSNVEMLQSPTDREPQRLLCQIVAEFSNGLTWRDITVNSFSEYSSMSLVDS